MWPSRPPDTTPLDFFLWGYVKDAVFRTKVKDTNDLKEKIAVALETIDKSMLRRTWTDIDIVVMSFVQRTEHTYKLSFRLNENFIAHSFKVV